jgi:hypothetical protein
MSRPYKVTLAKHAGVKNPTRRETVYAVSRVDARLKGNLIYAPLIVVHVKPLQPTRAERRMKI